MKKIILSVMILATTTAFANELSFPETVTASCGLAFVNSGSNLEVFLEPEEIEGSQALENARVELVRTSVSKNIVEYQAKETNMFKEGAPSYKFGLTLMIDTQPNSKGMLNSQLTYSIVGPTGIYKNQIPLADTIIGLNGTTIEWLSYSHDAVLANYGQFSTTQRTGLVNCSVSK